MLRAQLGGAVRPKTSPPREPSSIACLDSSTSDPRFVTLRAGWLHANGQSSQARAMLEQALRDRPDDPALLSALGHILLEGMSTPGTASGGATDGALKALAEKLAPVSRTANQDHLVAIVQARRGALALAMAHEKRALSRDENCVRCRVLLAELYDLRGHPANALAQAQLAEGLLRDGRRVPQLSRADPYVSGEADRPGRGQEPAQVIVPG